VEVEAELLDRPASGCDPERLLDFLADCPDRLAPRVEPERLPGFLAELSDGLAPRFEPDRPLRRAAGFFLFFAGAVFLLVVLFLSFSGAG
jgi:hypothetical protein